MDDITKVIAHNTTRISAKTMGKQDAMTRTPPLFKTNAPIWTGGLHDQNRRSSVSSYPPARTRDEVSAAKVLELRCWFV